MSNLVEFAESEMRRAGLYDKDADYGGMIPEAVLALVKIHAAQGHSGGSHQITMAIFHKVINFKPLTPLTDDPAEWCDRTEVSGCPMWQNVRQPDAFSTDGGKTWYSVDDERRDICVSVPRGEKL